MPHDNDEHAPRTESNALTPEQIQTIKQKRLEELQQHENDKEAPTDRQTPQRNRSRFKKKKR